ncbi:MAG: hypothetical protein ACRED5_19760 [Propylenella sp.]
MSEPHLTIEIWPFVSGSADGAFAIVAFVVVVVAVAAIYGIRLRRR